MDNGKSQTPSTDAGADPAGIRLARAADGGLIFRADAQAPAVEGVRVARCFPWSNRESYLSIRDGEGGELCLLRSLDAVSPDARRLIEEELGAQEFVPRIEAIEAVDDRFEVTLWRVRTDRGPAELQVEHADDVRLLDDGRVLIKDHAGGLFEVSNPAALDARGRGLLEDHLG